LAAGGAGLAIAPARCATDPTTSAPRALALHAVTHGAHVDALDFSPDGRAIAYQQGSAIHIHRDDGSPDAVIDADPAPCVPCRWSPRGDAVVALTGVGSLDLVKIPVDGGAVTVVAKAAVTDDHCGPMAISPNGRQLALVVPDPRTEIVRIGAAGAEAKPLTDA